MFWGFEWVPCYASIRNNFAYVYVSFQWLKYKYLARFKSFEVAKFIYFVLYKMFRDVLKMQYLDLFCRNVACGAGSVVARLGGLCAPQLLYLVSLIVNTIYPRFLSTNIFSQFIYKLGCRDSSVTTFAAKKNYIFYVDICAMLQRQTLPRKQ